MQAAHAELGNTSRPQAAEAALHAHGEASVRRARHAFREHLSACTSTDLHNAAACGHMLEAGQGKAGWGEGPCLPAPLLGIVACSYRSAACRSALSCCTRALLRPEGRCVS